METIKLIHGECLAEMDKLIGQDIKVDAIITDPPYGTTSCKWDLVIPLDAMWKRLNALIKPNGAICLFGSQPFTSLLVSSNIKCFKYEWIYQKVTGGNFTTAKYQPMKDHENICVFSKDSGRVNYYPIMQPRTGSGAERMKAGYKNNINTHTEYSNVYNNLQPNNEERKYDPDSRNPSSVQLFNNRSTNSRGLHPTQKPVDLMEYLVKTYTQENELVLDFTAGSFTTAIACINTNRQFIGIELDDWYYNIGVDRVNEYKGILR